MSIINNKTKAVKELLPIEEDPQIIELLNAYFEGIEELVSFGTHILKWDAIESRGGDENIPIQMMLRRIVELLDASSILIKNSIVEPCKSYIRMILEIILGLDYILEKDTTNRALSFIVWNRHKQIKFLNKLNVEHQSSKDFKRKLESDKLFQKPFEKLELDRIEEKIKESEKLFALPNYIPIEGEYQRVKQLKKNFEWYEMFNGPKNIESLAVHLNRQGLYEVLYRMGSDTIHSLNVIDQNISKSADGNGEIHQIRYAKDIRFVTHSLFDLGLLTYTLIIDKRIPNHKSEFKLWYKNVRHFNINFLSKDYIKYDE